MPSTYEALALDEAVGDAPAVVGAAIVDDDEPAAREPGDRHGACPDPGPNQRADRHERELGRLGQIRVLSQLV